MYSPNSAYEAGRRIGRRCPDEWVPEQDLFNAVQREIRPQIRPRSERSRREASQLGGTAAFCLFLTAFSGGILFAAKYYSDAEWVPKVFFALPQQTVEWIVVGLGALTVLTTFFYWSADMKAKRQRRRLREKLVRAAYSGALEVIDARRVKSARATPSVRDSRPAPSAAARSFSSSSSSSDLTPRDAEELAARWMRSMGAQDVEVTQYVGDGGVDVTSAKYIAQVKRFAANVGVAPIRELSGVVRSDGRRGLFFTTTGYSPGAITFATDSGIALFTMDYSRGQLFENNHIAIALRRHGLHQ